MHFICTTAADKGVVAVATIEGVVARTAIEDVVASVCAFVFLVVKGVGLVECCG